MNLITDDEKLRILILDNDVDIRNLLTDLLSDSYDLVLTNERNEFDEILHKYSPHIILLDLILPDAYGINICKNIRNDARFKDIFILILTASDDAKTIERGYSSGADDFIRKPFIPYEIESKIKIFEKIIRTNSSLNFAYLDQIKQNRKLNILNHIIEKNLSINNIDASFMLAEFFHEIINIGFLELVKADNGTFHSVLKKTYNNNVGYKSFSQLNTIYNIHKISDYKVDEKIQNIELEANPVTIYCCISSLYYRSKIYGYILMESDIPFKSDDKEIISLYSDFFSLINDRIHIEKILEEKNREYKAEISKIRNIQVAILPNFNDIKGYDISSSYLPAQELSGDFFDGFFVDEYIYQIILCDVSGHGMASSYVGNEIRTLFRTVSITGRSPAEIAQIVNNTIANDLQRFYYFCTVIICQLNLENGKIRYINAGHPPALLYKKEEKACHRLMHTGPLIGTFKNTVYDEKEISMEKDDCMLLYTDGITEAGGEDLNITGNMFGEERLIKLFHERQNYSPNDILHSIIGSVYEFTNFNDQEDDITVICIKKR